MKNKERWEICYNCLMSKSKNTDDYNYILKNIISKIDKNIDWYNIINSVVHNKREDRLCIGCGKKFEHDIMSQECHE